MKRILSILATAVFLLAVVISVASCDSLTKNKCSHTYDNNCDIDCNNCGETRTVEDHVYTNSCDTDCNSCGKMRVALGHAYTNNCDIDCNNCGYIRTVSQHIYTGICDDECNECGIIRVTIPHAYSNACDKYCNVCGETRVASPHVYDNDCDVDCNICGAIRSIKHNFEAEINGTHHWNECSKCNTKKNYEMHIYSSECDKRCNACEYIRVTSVAHSYPSAYYKDSISHWQMCTLCGNINDFGSHNYVNQNDDSTHWKECSVCRIKMDNESHIYDNDCDTNCNICNSAREITHKYEFTWDNTKHWNECTVCHNIADEAHHLYSHSCDTTCNAKNCEWVREVEDHPFNTEIHVYDSDKHWYECPICKERCDLEIHIYDILKFDADNHWYECECGRAVDIKDHNYYNACDKICNLCAYERNVEPHPYSDAWTSDEYNHWHQCTECGDKTDILAHTDANVCGATCNICGKTRDVHINKDEYGFCSLCGVYAGKTVYFGDDVVYYNTEGETTTLYYSFYTGGNWGDRGPEYELYIENFGDWFEDFDAYVMDENGDFIRLDDLTLYSNEYIYLSDYDNTIYLVIRVDPSISELIFTLNYFYVFPT